MESAQINVDPVATDSDLSVAALSGLEPLDSEYAVEVFKALGHPVRLEIMHRMVNMEELSCTELEETLPIAKTTISYHIKLLYRAGLIDIRKAGRFYFYTSRDEAIESFAGGLLSLLRHRVG